MIKRTFYISISLALAALLIAVVCFYSYHRKIVVGEYTSADRSARIYPDYTDIVIPPNIAPLNFMVREKGRMYHVKIYSDNGAPIEIDSRKPGIEIPVRRWKKLLSLNPGQSIFLDIYVKDDSGLWTKFNTIANTVANAPIDRYLTYRKIDICVQWTDMGIYQRDLENFDESIILHNSSFDTGCVHCHSFLNNNPDNMVMQIRSADHGTPMLIAQEGKVAGLNTSTEVTSGKVGFTSWHPNGQVIAFSINKYSMLYHSAASEVRDVFDNASDLALYLIDSSQVISTGNITKPDRMETFPEWSPDGRYLYFCSAPQLPPEQHTRVQCDLMRISYDCNTRKWGDLETVLAAQQVNGSITQPSFSPDGRFLIFNVSPYSDFPIHQAKSDLYLMEIQTSRYRRLDISSQRCDTWHSWSINNRWIAFTSKRLDGRFARLFLSYVDQTGKAHKPFIMPQKDPTFYDSLTRVYNMPELIVKPVPIKPKQFSNAVIEYKNVSPANAITGATPGRPLRQQKDKTAPISQTSWGQRE